MGIGHVVWDWNGTLVDDFAVMVEATSASCRELLGRAVTADDHRTHFARPVHLLYEGLLGRPVTVEEWDSINSRFHRAYSELAATATLATDAKPALRAAGERGCTQSLLSMWMHDELLRAIDALELPPLFVRVDGLPIMSDGGGKREHLVNHLDKLSADLGRVVAVDTVLVIGDSIDDAVAALEVGAQCVLVEGGSHHAAELATVGVPVAGSLIGALEIGLGPV